ncbi:MAG TPA: hypothetical protein PLU53_06135 [Bacteroidia bacterium]|nr:hypothetical protein [Bacteroidia bacterium]
MNFKNNNQYFVRSLPLLKDWKKTFLFSVAGMIMLFSAPSLSAAVIRDDVNVLAKIDTNQIRIGEQILLNLTASAPAGIKLHFPLIPDTLNGLEFVSRSGIDTTNSADGRKIIYSQAVKVTAFDSGFYVLQPFQFLIEQNEKAPDTLSTEALLISVRTIPVDTTKEIKDIKATMDVPLSWKEILVYVVAAIVLIALVLLILREIRRRKKLPKPEITVSAPQIPPHTQALEALKKIAEEKMWQQGNFKGYHSAVSDTLRLYIEGRFEINAMELTTDETMARFRGNSLSAEARQKISGILQLADMIKFAKVIPVGPENEQTMADAVQFILLTKPAEASDFKELEVKS